MWRDVFSRNPNYRCHVIGDARTGKSAFIDELAHMAPGRTMVLSSTNDIPSDRNRYRYFDNEHSHWLRTFRAPTDCHRQTLLQVDYGDVSVAVDLKELVDASRHDLALVAVDNYAVPPADQPECMSSRLWPTSKHAMVIALAPTTVNDLRGLASSFPNPGMVVLFYVESPRIREELYADGFRHVFDTQQALDSEIDELRTAIQPSFIVMDTSTKTVFRGCLPSCGEANQTSRNVPKDPTGRLGSTEPNDTVANGIALTPSMAVTMSHA